MQNVNIIRSINLSCGNTLVLAQSISRKESITISLAEHLFAGSCDCISGVCDKVCDEVCDNICDSVCDEICEKICDSVCDAICDANCSSDGGGNPCDSDQQCSCICEING